MESVRLDERYAERLLERFLEYVKVDTRSDPSSDSVPSTEGQKVLAQRLAQELRDLGMSDAHMDEMGYVYAHVPPRGKGTHRVPGIGFLAHMDTYFGVSGEGVDPQVVENYQGGPIALPGTSPAEYIEPANNPNLAKCKGHTIVTSDGRTLLGADDKAGLAEIVTALEFLRDHPHISHGPLSVCFTVDEEIGRGTDHIDLDALGVDVAYTVDGADLGEIEDENFCADSARLVVRGRDVHPGYAKGKMVNAVRTASWIVASLDQRHLPETTEGRGSFVHPYEVRGNVSETVVELLVRAFSVEELEERERHLRGLAQEAAQLFDGVEVELECKESYRNMALKLREDPRVLGYAEEAIQMMGITPKRRAIRGGTDGARLCFMGVLTPNLWAGGQNFHSTREWVSLQWMVAACECLVNLARVWAHHEGDV